MKHSQPTNRTTAALWLSCGLLALGGLAACSGGGGASAVSQDGNSQAGTFVLHNGKWFLADNNQAGNAQEPRIVRQMHGRLVEVFGLDAFGARVPMFSDYVISTDLLSDGQNYLRETNPVTSQNLLVILRDVTDQTKNGGLSQFFKLLLQAEQNLSPIHENDANGAGLYSMVPRNGAIVVQFDDLIDASTLSATTFRFKAGTPPVVPFESRVLVDRNHGDLTGSAEDGNLTFYGTRIIIDTTVSELESFSQDPPLPVNGIGLPPSSDVNLANIEIRIPTKLNANVGQLDLLRNPSGHAITAKANGPTDDTFGTEDVVRAARSGGASDVTGDKYNGFMLDLLAPQLVGNTPTTIDTSPVVIGNGVFKLPSLTFQSVFCAQTPQPGDVLRQPGIFAEVLQAPAPVNGNGEVSDLFVRLLLFPFDNPDEWATGAVGQAQFLAAYDPVEDLGREACFVRAFPDAEGFPENPVTGVATDATYSLRFSEPMDPVSLTAFDSVTITRLPIPEEGALTTSDYVVGTLLQSVDLQEFTYLPNLPLAHQSGIGEPYWFSLSTKGVSPTDLAGNSLADAFPQVEMSVDPNEVTQFNGGRVTRFTGVDEEEPFGDQLSGPLPEWTGQLLYDLSRQLIKPRPVVHFNSTADTSKPVPKLMTPFPPGVQTPLSGLGSRMMTVWRYADFGWSLTDASNHNIDVEGLYWSPAQGSIVAETFTEFSIRVGHSKYLPDEYIDPASLFPKYEDSGLDEKFDNNWLLKADNKLVHSKEKGYSVNPGDLFVHPVSGTKFIPFPWNQDATPADWKTWTWRNSAQRKRAGNKGSSGAPLMQEYIATGQAFPSDIDSAIYRVNNVRAEGLPMLMEFKCYPDDGAVGLNAFNISLAANSSSKPYFRAFSTGGISGQGPEPVDPDTETKANGGWNPGTNPPSSTFGRDNTFYIGAADFVTRVSRVHSVWFEADDPFQPPPALFPNPIYTEPILEPRMEDQPDGTSVALAFRGASNILTEVRFICGTAGDPNFRNREPLENARSLDSFGDYYDLNGILPTELGRRNATQENKACDDTDTLKKYINFLDDDSDWKADMGEVDTAPYYQVRITFESDIFTGLVPEVSALAVSWHD
jgi:hypothetical protein